RPHLTRAAPHRGHAIAPEARRIWASAADNTTITAATCAHGRSVSPTPRCHTRGQLVLRGAAFAHRVPPVADERPNRHRGEHGVAALTRELGRRRHRHAGGADEPK